MTDGMTRRGLLVAGGTFAGYALAADPVLAQAIKTDTQGIVAGEHEVKIGDYAMPVYEARPQGGGNHPVLLVLSEIWGVHEYIRDGKLHVHQVDPGQLSPGEFAMRVREAAETGSRFIAIDSLNGYMHAMTGERAVALQLHELLSFLDGQGVISMLLLAQHGLVTPQLGRADRDFMELQAETLKVDAWKCYTGSPPKGMEHGWWMDDEAIAYPMLEKARALKIPLVCVHKGLPLGTVEEYAALATERRHLYHLWFTKVLRAMRAHLAGRMTEAEELCEDILIMNKGKQVARGDLYALKLLSQDVYEVAMTFETLPASIETELEKLAPLRMNINQNTLELTVTIDDPQIYTKPWLVRNRMPLRLLPAGTDWMEMIPSASEAQAYQRAVVSQLKGK